MTFQNRADAGRQLAEELLRLDAASAFERPVVVALPRGGVPVAFEVAKALSAPLEVLIVRKIGAPGHPEVGLGALVDGSPPQVILNPTVMAAIRPSKAFVEAETRRELDELARRRRVYVGDHTPFSVAGRTVVLVDDGIATGGTVRAALQGLKQARPERLVLSVPVAPRDVAKSLRGEVDDLVCLRTPERFVAVGLHYGDFGQTSDQEVVELLEAAERSWRAPTSMNEASPR